MAKAFKWLTAHNIPYVFFNYREQTLNESTVLEWLANIAPETLINKKSTTYRELADADKIALNDVKGRMPVLLQNPTLFKRPVWNFGNGTFYAGWNEEHIAAIIKG